MRNPALIIPIVAALSLSCGGSPSSPSGGVADTGRYSGPYSYANQQSGVSSISGTLSFDLPAGDFSEIRNIQVVVNGCENANAQAESVSVPLGNEIPGRSERWFTIPLRGTIGTGIYVNCVWDAEHHQRSRATCGLSISVNKCGLFGGSAKEYGFTVSK
jgi:hypothetical protein